MPSVRQRLILAASAAALLWPAAPTSADHLPPRAGFTAQCEFSHSLPDDPIVYPERPRRSHQHDFFGATDTDAFSTPSSIRRASTTCDKPEDRSAYWVPALYRDGEKVDPTFLTAYYTLDDKHPGDIKPYPDDLRIIAGDPDATRPQGIRRTTWGCASNDRQILSDAPPRSCPDGYSLILQVRFPDCWDGVNLDSDDHQSHMAYAQGRTVDVCPPSHPVEMPSFRLTFHYRSLSHGKDVELASGGVYSAHADFMNGWEAKELKALIDECINGVKVCD